MIGLDTNVLVRYIAQDDPNQSTIATNLMNSLTKERPGFITMVSMVELVWVMQSCYKSTKMEIVNILETILATRELIIENAETVIRATHLYSGTGADFSDCLIERSANKAGCEYSVTFDIDAIKHPGFRSL
jgi:predicted nucleic-acid-binding protein